MTGSDEKGAVVPPRSDITSKAKAADADPEFSARIRDGLPGAHPVLARQ